MQHTIKPHWKFIERANLETLQKEVNDFSDKNEVQDVLLTARQGGTGAIFVASIRHLVDITDLEIKRMMAKTAGFTDYLKAPDRCAAEKKREYEELYRKCERELLGTPAPF